MDRIQFNETENDVQHSKKRSRLLTYLLMSFSVKWCIPRHMCDERQSVHKTMP